MKASDIDHYMVDKTRVSGVAINIIRYYISWSYSWIYIGCFRHSANELNSARDIYESL